MQTERHQFALFYAKTSQLRVSGPSGMAEIFDDQELLHRLIKVLRVRPDQTVMLFDAHYHASILIVELEKHRFFARVLDRACNQSLVPAIHWMLPFLERDAFEEACSLLTVFGATSIQPLVTKKTYRDDYVSQERERLHRRMIAAAEQSKQWVIPAVRPVLHLDVLEKTGFTEYGNAHRLFFDPCGTDAFDVVEAIRQENMRDHVLRPMVCLVGPEGDLCETEKLLLKKEHFLFVALTPTVLRAQHAVIVAMGMLRSLLR